MNEVINCHVMKKLSHISKKEYIAHLKGIKKSGLKKFQIYPSINEVFSLFKRNMPRSLIKSHVGEYYIIVAGRSKDTFDTVAVSFKYKFFIPTLAMNFHDIIMDLSMTKLDLKSISIGDIRGYILALPELTIDGYLNEQCGCAYYVVDSDWNELDQQMQFNKPKSPGCKY